MTQHTESNGSGKEEENVFQDFYEKEIHQFSNDQVLTDDDSGSPPSAEALEKITGESTEVLSVASTVASVLLSISTSAIAMSSSSLDATTTLSIDQASATSTSIPRGSQPGATVRLNESTSLSVASTIIIELLKLVFGHVPYFIFRYLSGALL